MMSMARLLRPIRNAIMLMVNRAVLRLVNDGTGLQTVQATVLADETLDGVEHFQHYGFTAHPHPGAECVALSANGRRSNLIIVAIDDRRYRLRPLAEGEVAVHDDQGRVVHLTRSGIRMYAPDDITIYAGGKLRLEGEQVEIKAREWLDTDVHGYAERLTWTGGTAWRTDTWHDGAVVTGTPDQPVRPQGGE